MEKNIKRLVVHPEICAGCRSCEVACSFHHEKKFDPKASRIRVGKIEKYGIDYPMFCQVHEICYEKPLCASVCQMNAITKDESTGAVKVNHDLCTRCRLCESFCLFGAIRLGRAGRIIVCDLCGGDPTCVKSCPTGALRFETVDLTASEISKKKLKLLWPLKIREESFKVLSEELLHKLKIPV